MSENATPVTPNETTGTPSPTPAPTAAEPWRAGQHSRFAGKTPEEILGIAEGLAIVAERFNQPMPVVEPRSRFDLDISDDDYVQGRQVKQLVQTLVNQGPPVDETARNLAAQGLYTNLRATFADDFKRWGSEIDAEIRRLPVAYWTYDALNTIVKMVRANHIDEIAAEKAQRLLNEQHPTIRSGTGGLGGGPLTQQKTLESEGLPKGWVDQARAKGIDESVIAEFCRETGQTPEQYLADVERYGKNAGVIRG